MKSSSRAAASEIPTTVLKENGIPVPAGVAVKAVENSDTVVHLTLPAKPKGGVSKEVLDKAMSDGFWDDLEKVLTTIAPPILGSLGI